MFNFEQLLAALFVYTKIIFPTLNYKLMLNIKFIKSVYSIQDLPKGDIPELVLCGRSNVGKSSFINSLSKKKNIAKTSSTPGKTR